MSFKIYKIGHFLNEAVSYLKVVFNSMNRRNRELATFNFRISVNYIKHDVHRKLPMKWVPSVVFTFFSGSMASRKTILNFKWENKESLLI